MKEWRALLGEGRPLKIKFGADVTAPFMHLGHAVNLWMMRAMQERGHRVQFLIGDFTTLIGDPTGRSGARAARSAAEIERDAEAFIRQVGKILIVDDPRLFEVRRNSSWWATKPLAEFIELLGAVNVPKLLSRDMFKARLRDGKELGTHELVYPVLQGWDSVELDSDLTIVGSDQLFNEAMGRFFQARSGKRPLVVITTKITPGLDGANKQSKSLNNFVALDDTPRDCFGKLMSLPDRLVVEWLTVYTELPMARVREIDEALARGGCNPRDAKLELARAVTARLHGAEAASREERWFIETIAGRAFPEEAPLVSWPGATITALELAALSPANASPLAAVPSRSELRRLIAQGGLELDGRRVSDPLESIPLGGGEHRVKVGRRGFFRLQAAATSSGVGSTAASWGPSGAGC
jgi:tyrosyl-tRNA synthetase